MTYIIGIDPGASGAVAILQRDGGLVQVSGSAVIDTHGHYASGILALSEGGDGGTGRTATDGGSHGRGLCASLSSGAKRRKPGL